MLVKYALLHEVAHIPGIGQIGPRLGEGGPNTQSQTVKLSLDSDFLVLTYPTRKFLIPVSNIRNMEVEPTPPKK